MTSNFRKWGESCTALGLQLVNTKMTTERAVCNSSKRMWRVSNVLKILQACWLFLVLQTAFWCIGRTMHVPWNYLYPISWQPCSFTFADSARCQFAVVLHDDFPTFAIGIIQVCIVTGLIAEILLKVFSICNTVKQAEHICSWKWSIMATLLFQ